MKDIIGFILLICLLISDFIKPNETKYTPKRINSRVYVWLIWIMQILANKMTHYAITYMKTKSRRSEIIGQMRRNSI